MAIFSTYPVKTPPAGADQVMIADSAAGGACKLVAISDLIIAAAENVLYVMVDDTLLADDPDNLRFTTFSAAITEVNTNYSTYPTIVVLVGGVGPYDWGLTDFTVANPRISLVKVSDVSNPTVTYAASGMLDFPFDLLTVDFNITLPGSGSVTLHITDPRSTATISFDGDVVDTVQFHELYGQYIQIKGDLGTADVRVLGFDNDVVVGNLIVSNFGFVDLGVFADGALATTRSTNIEHFDTAAIDVLRINSQNAVIKESIISAGLLVFGGSDLDVSNRGIRNTTMNIRHTITKIARDTCTAPNILDDYAVEYPYATYGLITFDGMQNCNINFESIDFSGLTAPTAFAFKSIFSQRSGAFVKYPYVTNSSIRVGTLAGLASFTAANFTGFSATPTIWDNDASTDYNVDSKVISSSLVLKLSENGSDAFIDTIFNTDVYPGDGLNIFLMHAEDCSLDVPVVGVLVDANPTNTYVFGAGDGTTGLVGCKLNIDTICYKDSDGAGGRAATLAIVNSAVNTDTEVKIDYLSGSVLAPTLANTYGVCLRTSTDIKRFYTTGPKEVFTLDLSYCDRGSEFKFPQLIGFPCFLNLSEDSGVQVTVRGGSFDTFIGSPEHSNFYDLRIGTSLRVTAANVGTNNNFHVTRCADVTFDASTSDNKVYGPVTGTITDSAGGFDTSGNLCVSPSLKSIMNQEDIIPIEFCADGVVVAPDAAEDYTNTNAKLRVRKFAGGAVNDVIFQWPVPKYMDVAVKPQFLVEYVISEAAPAATKVVAFSLAGYCVGNGDDTNAAFGAAVESSKTYGAGAAQNDRDTTAQSGDVTVTNLAAGGLAFFNLTRLGTTTDTYAEKVAVTNVKIFWKRL